MITTKFRIRMQLSQFEVLPPEGASSDTIIPETVKADPPIDGEALDSLKNAVMLEVEDGRLVSFMTPKVVQMENKGKVKVFMRWEHDNESWQLSTA